MQRRNQRRGAPIITSHCGEIITRGQAPQLAGKYEALARVAAGEHDRVMEQSYLQHAEHYRRIHNSVGRKLAQLRVEQKFGK